jgi:hypothetical protein
VRLFTSARRSSRALLALFCLVMMVSATICATVSEAMASDVAGYAFVDPNQEVPQDLLRPALIFFELNKEKISNREYLTIVDFSQRSSEHRFFIVNMNSGKVWSTTVAHGKGSDVNHDGYATVFSNSFNSDASSLGFFLTAEIYNGHHGRSLALDGLSATNSNVRARAVVIHGADYVSDANVIQGRSFGCFALPMNERSRVIDMLKNGSLIYAGLSQK